MIGNISHKECGSQPHSFFSTPLAFVANMLIVYLVYAVCRGVYLWVNWKMFAEGWGALSGSQLLWGSFRFDTSAILYTNILYALLMLLPCPWKETKVWQQVARWVYVVMNSLCVAMNLADAVYFQYTGRRTTASVFQEFSHEDNLGGVFGIEVVRHWYLFVIGILLMFVLYRCYVKPHLLTNLKGKRLRLYLLAQTLCLLLFVPLCIAGMRGGFTHAVRPITISNANQYVNRPTEAALVLNTPFSMIRTFNKSVFKDPKFFDRSELDAIYSPIHEPVDSIAPKQKNVVVLILESFAKEYIGAYNDYPGYTPFVDSLITQSLTYDYTFANGRKSIDGMPSILSSIPRFMEPFFLTPASLNDISSLAGELGKKGYYSAFFHGAENGSMGFEAYAKTSGFKDYFGRTEYNEDKRFHGDADFDGMWAIWDEEFLQFYALKMSEIKQPFCTAVFTASSHHPFNVPDKYKEVYKDEPGDGNVMHKCIRYVDFCLKRFFETASKQPWYQNTIFVLTADHTNVTTEKAYQTDLGLFSVPVIFFDPSGEMPKGKLPGVAQQIDIEPTILDYLGYDQPYLAFGKDVLRTPEKEMWAVNHNNGIYQYVKGDYVLQLTEDGNVKAIYNYKTDWFMQHNLKGKVGPIEQEMQRTLKAMIQSYMIRMSENELKPNSAYSR